MLEQLQRIADELKNPIPGPDPCGEDPKYEDSFAELKEEVAKTSGMGSGATDWEKVANLSADMLRQSAKELNLMAYLITSWTQRYQLPGLVLGLEVLAHFVQESWNDIHPKPMPKRKKPRALTLAWLQTQIGERLESCQSQDRALLERGIAACASLKDYLYDYFEDPPANFKNARKKMEEWLALAPGAVVETAEAPAETGSPAPPSTAAPAPMPAPQPQNRPPSNAPPVVINAPTVAADADTDALYEALDQIAAQFGALSPTDTMPYLLRRIALWDGASLPNHDESRETFFPAPDTNITDSLKNMMSRSAWTTLLEKVEDLMRARWYWLDLQYYAAQAARGLEAEAVVRIIEERVLAFDKRLPDLKELKFNDGTAFANPTTKDWLSHIVIDGGEGGSGAAEDPAQMLLSAMRKRGVEGFGEAMGDAQAAIKAAPDARTAFRLKLEAARFCIEAEQFYWAESLAEALVSDIEHHDLDHWEPELAGGAWAVLLEVARELKSSEDGYLATERRAMKALAALDLSRLGSYPKNKPVY